MAVKLIFVSDWVVPTVAPCTPNDEELPGRKPCAAIIYIL